MKKIVSYLRGYWSGLNKSVFLLATLFTALAVFINYRVGLNTRINRLDRLPQFAAWYGLFLSCLVVGYGVQRTIRQKGFALQKEFVLLLLLAPLVFAWKMTATIHYDFSNNTLADAYWNAVVYWPFKVVVMVSMLYLLHRRFHRGNSFYGATFQGFEAKPYLLMLAMMLPLITAAAALPDFQQAYPRFQSIDYLLQPGRLPERLLYELAYGSDFFSIELYFRGLLVLGFSKWAGEQAILPMAIFYCSIHFGKPLGECISSYFGGLILGVVAYHTRSILGGFFVHVGIAWLMELAGSVALSN